MRSLRVGHRETQFSSHAAGSLISCSDWEHQRMQTLACRPQPGAHSLPRCPSAWWVNSAAGSLGPETHKEKKSFHSGKRACQKMVRHNTHLSNADTHHASITESIMRLPRTGDTHRTNTNTNTNTYLAKTGGQQCQELVTHRPTQTHTSPTSR